MSFEQCGIVNFNSEVTNITNIGFWLLVDDREYFVPFADYPVFRKATVAQIYVVEQLLPQQFHWPDLDADIELDTLPERYFRVFHKSK